MEESKIVALALDLLKKTSTATMHQVSLELLNWTKRDFFMLLPVELALQVLSWTDCYSLYQVSLLSKGHWKLCTDNSIWRVLYFKQGWTIDSEYLINSLSLIFNGKSLEAKKSARLEKKHIPMTDDLPQQLSRRNTDEVLSSSFTSEVPDTTPDTKFQPLQVQPEFIHVVNQSLLSRHDAIIDWKWIFRQRMLLEKNWREQNFECFEFQGHDEAIYCLQFDSDKIITGSRDDTIKIWDLETKECVHTLEGHTGSVLCLHYNANYLVSGSSDSTIIVWSLLSGTFQKRLYGHSESVLGIILADGNIISCSKDSTIKVWDFDSGSVKRTLNGHRTAVNAIQYKNNLIVSASGDRTIKIWSLETGEELRTISGHSRGIACLQFDGNLIVSGSSDQTIRIWDVKSGSLMNTLRGHSEVVRTLQFDSKKIISGSYDGTVRIWGLEDWRRYCVLATSLSFSRIQGAIQRNQNRIMPSKWASSYP